MTLRAYAYKEGMEPTDVDTQTYIFLPRVLTQPHDIDGWDTYHYSGNGGPAWHDYEMDPEIVEDTAYSAEIIEGLKAIPTLSLVGDAEQVWDAYRGDTETLVSIEVIYPEELSDENESTTALMELHSYDRVVLRGGNNRSWARSWNPDRTTYTTDEWIRATQIAMSGVGVHGTFVHLYVNGIYWGLYNPVERPDEHFSSAHFGGESEDWFSVSHGGPHDGDSALWDYLSTDLKNKDMSELANYAELQESIDLSVLVDYLLLHWYAGIMDRPGNNWWAGVPNNPPGPALYYAWDGEWSFGVGKQSPDQPEVHTHFDSGQDKWGPAVSADLFNSAKDSEEFRILLADRAYRALFNDGALTPDKARARWAALGEHLRSAVVAESARWGDAVDGGPTRTRNEDWEQEYAFQDTYMETGAPLLVSSLRDEGYYPELDPPLFSVNGSLLVVTELELEEPFDLVIDVDGELGSVVYTTDGSDPRAVGGDPVGIDAGAGTTITIDDVGLVRARTLDGVDWSAVHELVVRLPEPDEEEEQEEEDSDPADSGAVPGPGDADCGCGSTEGSRAAWLLVLWAIGAASQRRLSPLN